MSFYIYLVSSSINFTKYFKFNHPAYMLLAIGYPICYSQVHLLLATLSVIFIFFLPKRVLVMAILLEDNYSTLLVLKFYSNIGHMHHAFCLLYFNNINRPLMSCPLSYLYVVSSAV